MWGDRKGSLDFLAGIREATFEKCIFAARICEGRGDPPHNKPVRQCLRMLFCANLVVCDLLK